MNSQFVALAHNPLHLISQAPCVSWSKDELYKYIDIVSYIYTQHSIPILGDEFFPHLSIEIMQKLVKIASLYIPHLIATRNSHDGTQ